MRSLPLSRRKALLNAEPDSLIRLYTLQHDEAIEEARKRGYFTGSHNHDDGDDDWKDFWLGHYQWMRDEMAKVIPDFTGDLPMWAYPKRARAKKGTVKKGESWITVLVPRKRILFSDYELWHTPLNNGAIVFSEAEDDAFDYNSSDAIERKRATWHHIFDITRPHHPYIGGGEWVQACVDRIYLDEIVSIRS